MGWIPALVAASQRREEQEAIEQLQREDVRNMYEYKILHSYRFDFASQARLRAILDEEAQAGWEMAAKMDESRLVLRRLRSSRHSDDLLPPGVDPYRSAVDANFALLVIASGIALLAVILGFDLLASRQGIAAVIAAVVIVLAVGVAGLALRARWRP